MVDHGAAAVLEYRIKAVAKRKRNAVRSFIIGKFCYIYSLKKTLLTLTNYM